MLYVALPVSLTIVAVLAAVVGMGHGHENPRLQWCCVLILTLLGVITVTVPTEWIMPQP